MEFVSGSSARVHLTARGKGDAVLFETSLRCPAGGGLKGSQVVQQLACKPADNCETEQLRLRLSCARRKHAMQSPELMESGSLSSIISNDATGGVRRLPLRTPRCSIRAIARPAARVRRSRWLPVSTEWLWAGSSRIRAVARRRALWLMLCGEASVFQEREDLSSRGGVSPGNGPWFKGDDDG